MTQALSALTLGSITVAPAVVLAPMAGVTNAAYRQLCREQGAGLAVCEMVTSRGLVEGDPKTAAMVAFDAGDTVRSVQLFGVEPRIMGQAVRVLCEDYGVGHVDLNFGCPVPKVTRRGGGAALPWKRRLFAAIVSAAVDAGADYGIPVTVKTRMGIDENHLTYRDAGRIAADAGAAAIALHGRTARQHYSGRADWTAIADLVSLVDIPVLGNGDVWEAADAVAMVEQTGCAGVVIGRGCLGRPWLFRDLAAVAAGKPTPPLPALGEVAAMMRRHAELLGDLVGEDRGCREMRKHMAWYLKGFSVGSPVRQALGMVSTLTELDALLGQVDPGQPFPRDALGAPRGRQGTPKARVALPDGWLLDTDGLTLDLSAAELDSSGG